MFRTPYAKPCRPLVKDPVQSLCYPLMLISSFEHMAHTTLAPQVPNSRSPRALRALLSEILSPSGATVTLGVQRTQICSMQGCYIRHGNSGFGYTYLLFGSLDPWGKVMQHVYDEAVMPSRAISLLVLFLRWARSGRGHHHLCLEFPQGAMAMCIYIYMSMYTNKYMNTNTNVYVYIYIYICVGPNLQYLQHARRCRASPCRLFFRVSGISQGISVQVGP